MSTSDALNALLNEIGVQNASLQPTTPINFSQQPLLVVSEDSSSTHPTPVKGHLCLNMIVKNESRIIERLLGSVLSIIDTYCICDTGSTDNTADIIRTFMAAAKKPGIVYTEPFQNFGYNRTHALNRAAEWGTYALLLDADMKLVITPEFKASDLTADGYNIIQRSGSMEYYNTRIVKTGIGVRCISPTHEYYDFPPGKGNDKLSTLWIEDIGDGGAKADKFERDIRLLLDGLTKEPRNERYHFYLANSYRDLGKHAEAIEYYKKRIELGGWIEEVFYACYELGNMYKHIGDMASAVFWWLEAYNRHSTRAESLYEIVKYYRETGKQRVGQMICDTARAIPYPKDDVLFIKTGVYDYLLEYEHSILAYYTKAPIDHYKYIHLIGKDYCKQNVLSNYKFYVKKLAELGGVNYDFCDKATKVIMGRPDSFTSSSPCIVKHSEGYLLNVRYVNYTIRQDGGYDFKHGDGKITTLNRTYWLNPDLSVAKDTWMDKVQDESLRYQGVEDVKVFPHRGDLLFLGTVEHPTNGRVTVGRGKYDLSLDRLLSRPFDSPQDRGCEKNWCYFHNAAGDLKLVYEWSPLTIADVNDSNTIDIRTRDTAVPAFFRDVRGSSHGYLVDNEIWFLCHLVEYSTPRHYYNLIVVLDARTMAYTRHSILFKFHGDCIEYALGLVVEPERVLMSYSRMDRTSAVMAIPRSVVQKELFP